MEYTNIDDLFRKAERTCKKCYEHEKDISIRVPLPSLRFGRRNIKIMFIYERPGWKGAGASGLISPDNNDPTARQFNACFNQLGISLGEIFCTNACICYADQEDRKNDVPTKRAILNCHFWLEKQIQALNPKLIVPLGNVALKSLKLCSKFKDSAQLKRFLLHADIGKVIKDTSPWIYPLYHTSLRARLTRSAEQQKQDWLKIRHVLLEISGKVD